MKEIKRSNEPVFWALFGAGGMWGAIFAPVIILTMLLFPAFGADAGENLLWMARESIFGQLFMLLMIILPLWCGFHRVHHCLHDMKIHFSLIKPLCYGAALVFSVAAVWAVLAR